MSFKLRITTSRDGLRRGGATHNGTQSHLLGTFTVAQILQMLDEPKLRVDLVEEQESGATIIVPWPADRQELETGLTSLLSSPAARAKLVTPPPAESGTVDNVQARLAELEAMVEGLQESLDGALLRIAALEKQMAEGAAPRAAKNQTKIPEPKA